MNKKSLSERDICTKFIALNIVSAGWDVDTQVREEVGFTDDRIRLDPLSKLGSPVKIIRAFGGKPAYDATIHALTDELYKAA